MMQACTTMTHSAKAASIVCSCAAPHRAAAHPRHLLTKGRAAGRQRQWQAGANGDGGAAPDLRDEEPSTSGRADTDAAGAPPALRFPARVLSLLGAAGVAETGYLAWAKLFGGPVACPVSGSCDSVLNSDFAMIFGIPLSLLGLAGYGALTAVSASAAASSQPASDLQKTAVLANASVLAATSAYLVYILATQFPGDVCVWCLGSAATSLATFVTALRGLGTRQLGQSALPAGAAVLATIVGLSIAWQDASGPGSLADIDISYQATAVRNPSPSQAADLAKRLKAAGAKMYGAFWCSHCQEQKAEFGVEAQADLPYVECYPQGYHQGTKIEPACAAAGLKGFPSWVINGKQLSGEQTFEQLEAALAQQ